MIPKSRLIPLTGAVVAGLALAAQAAVLAGSNGMTLYTFDKDTGGVPTCYDACAAKWPPYLFEQGAMMNGNWTTVDRTDGTKQWAYMGKPVYFFADDKKAGDTKGDGVNNVWHAVQR